MSDRLSDKTNIKKSALDEPDVTRIASAGKMDGSVQARDKTRIAPSTTAAGKARPNADTAKTSADMEESLVITEVTYPSAADDEDDIADTINDYHPSTTTPADDKTRIAPPREDVTRVADNKKQPAGHADHVTRIDPRVNPAAEETQVSPGSPFNKPPDHLPLEAIDLQEVGDHGILKKRFILESVLGAGGMGIVYKARDLLKVEAQDRDPYVAIKVLGEEFKAHPEAFISLQRESRKSQRIAHPNIVNVHDFDRDGDTVFMTMEFLDGSPLDQLIRRYKSTGLPTEDAWAIIQGMCAALSHAHAEKIIHSDFKPGNVFVTKKGLAKVFDFGIARAVARVEHLDDNPKDKTVFDAGNLGALTPAYASLEMLEGKEPDVRDDIYALGCVAYELFTAQHPYKKTPANEAARLGLKPKRINNITRRQWKAIEKAIAFKREDRMESVDKFVEAISPKIRPANRMATAFALLLSVAITVYFIYFQEKPVVKPAYSEFDIRNELELKIKIDYLKEDLDILLNNPSFTNPWQDSVWKDISDLVVLTRGEDQSVSTKKQQIYQLYVNKISSEIDAEHYSSAQHFIQNAKRYTEDTSALDLFSSQIIAALKRQQTSRAAALEQDRIRKQQQAQKQQEYLLAQQKIQQENELKQQRIAQDSGNFNVALENVNDQLKCLDRLNMRNIETAVLKLRELDIERYNAIENNIVNSLAACIVQTGKSFPERALEAKKQALKLFKANAVLSNLVIKAKDACDTSLAGLGARGKRAICKDKIEQLGFGPDLVVIPGSSKIKVFAIGKYEVSINELNVFCKQTAFCVARNVSDVELPAADIDIKLVEQYLDWLSEQTGKRYRLPSKEEWLYAVKSRRKELDANRNCKLSTRGIQKGEGLVDVNIGKQNSWGLVNYVGNVQEWVYDKGRKLIAVGGSYAQSMDNCDITTINPHTGSADKITGFRLLREIRTSS